MQIYSREPKEDSSLRTQNKRFDAMNSKCAPAGKYVSHMLFSLVLCKCESLPKPKNVMTRFGLYEDTNNKYKEVNPVKSRITNSLRKYSLKAGVYFRYFSAG